MALARTERAALADLLAELGPHQPTLCAGWDTGDLLAHLLTRDRRPDASAGMVVGPLSGHLAAVMAGYRQRDWAEQVALLRSGPPRWSPMRWGPLNNMMNSVEYFVHHEDARRGQSGWQPRDLSDSDVIELTKLVKAPPLRVTQRRLPCGLLARLPDGTEVTLKKGAQPVVLTGAPGEILLWAFGRDACRVDLTGDESALAAIAAHRAA